MPKTTLPTEIHVLDLFCGNGMRLQMLARRHPKRNFVGVDQSKKGQPRQTPANLRFVEQDAVEFLRSRHQGGIIHQVNIDYGVHHLGEAKRRELFAHISQLLRPGGSLHVATYTEKGGSIVRPESIQREVQAAGLKLFKRAPFELGTSHSQYGLSAGSESTRLWFKKPRKKRV